jgi:hypothetical protein
MWQSQVNVVEELGGDVAYYGHAIGAVFDEAGMGSGRVRRH